MKLLPLAFAASLFCAGTAAAGGLDACDFESDFDLRIEPSGLAFHRDGGTPATVEMRSGRLVVDGREIALSAADRARVRRYEDTVRELVPEVKAIALDAIGIATEAVTQVAATFAGDDGAKSIARLREVGAEMRAKIESSDDTGEWNEAEFEAMVASLTAELVPMVVGDVTAIAIRVALSGDEEAAKELEERAERMERELEARVEKRADELEARAEALCPRVVELDALESELELRLADNRPLDLLQAD
jgi:hypothetical protein